MNRVQDFDLPCWLVEDFARRRNYLDKPRAPEALVREVALFLLYQNAPGTMSLGKMPRLSAEGLQLLSREIEGGISRFVNRQEGTQNSALCEQLWRLISAGIEAGSLQMIPPGRPESHVLLVSR